MQLRRIRLRGQDDLAHFQITRGTCDVCGKRRVVCVIYDRRKLSEGDSLNELMQTRVYQMLTWFDLLKYTILKKAYYSTGRGRVGIQCGCYAKLHRQLVHIANSVRRKPGFKEPAVANSPEIHNISRVEVK